MPPEHFIPGLELSRRFYWEAVRPLLDRHFPDMPHAAAKIGSGSDILGFDTARSTDHDWAPSVTIYLREEDFQKHGQAIHELLGEQLPFTFLGYSTHSAKVPSEAKTTFMEATTERPIRHSVRIDTVKRFFQNYLAWNPEIPLTALDWLTFPSQMLRAITAGAVHFDNVGDLSRIRQQLAWMPDDVWRYMMAAEWVRIGNAEPLMGRAGEAGDELGSSILASQLVRDIMRLCFLIERQYAPYAKWFGTAFQQLACAAELTPYLLDVQHGTDWKSREVALVPVYRKIAQMHNALQLTEPLPEEPTLFHDRPFLVSHGEDFADALLATITDEQLKPLLDRSTLGNIDQWSDHDVLRSNIAAWREKLLAFYQG